MNFCLPFLFKVSTEKKLFSFLFVFLSTKTDYYVSFMSMATKNIFKTLYNIKYTDLIKIKMDFNKIIDSVLKEIKEDKNKEKENNMMKMNTNVLKPNRLFRPSARNTKHKIKGNLKVNTLFNDDDLINSFNLNYKKEPPVFVSPDRRSLKGHKLYYLFNKDVDLKETMKSLKIPPTVVEENVKELGRNHFHSYSDILSNQVSKNTAGFSALPESMKINSNEAFVSESEAKIWDEVTENRDVVRGLPECKVIDASFFVTKKSQGCRKNGLPDCKKVFFSKINKGFELKHCCITKNVGAENSEDVTKVNAVNDLLVDQSKQIENKGSLEIPKNYEENVYDSVKRSSETTLSNKAKDYNNKVVVKKEKLFIDKEDTVCEVSNLHNETKVKNEDSQIKYLLSNLPKCKVVVDSSFFKKVECCKSKGSETAAERYAAKPEEENKNNLAEALSDIKSASNQSEEVKNYKLNYFEDELFDKLSKKIIDDLLERIKQSSEKNVKEICSYKRDSHNKTAVKIPASNANVKIETIEAPSIQESCKNQTKKDSNVADHCRSSGNTASSLLKPSKSYILKVYTNNSLYSKESSVKSENTVGDVVKLTNSCKSEPNITTPCTEISKFQASVASKDEKLVKSRRKIVAKTEQNLKTDNDKDSDVETTLSDAESSKLISVYSNFDSTESVQLTSDAQKLKKDSLNKSNYSPKKLFKFKKNSNKVTPLSCDSPKDDKKSKSKNFFTRAFKRTRRTFKIIKLSFISTFACCQPS